MRFAGLLCTMALCGIMLVAGARAQDTPAAGNLVKNPSFEQPIGPRKDYPEEKWGYGPLDGVARSCFAHWGYNGFWEGGEYDLKRGKGHTGKVAARLVCHARGRGGICTEEIRVPVGAKLRFSGWFKGVGAAGQCLVNFEGDPGEGWASIPLPRKDDYDWTEVTGTVTVKPPRGKRKVGEDGKVGIYIFIYSHAYGELWIDDISLTPAEEDEKAAEQKP